MGVGVGGEAGVTELDGADGLLVQASLAAVTVKVYVVLFARPSTVEVRVAPSSTAVTPAGLEVTVYWVMALPPSEAGAVQLTVAWLSPATADTSVGGPGGPTGVITLDADDGALVPTELVAVTVNV